MPHKKIWALLFFLMLLSLGFGSQICTVQGVVTAIQDIVPERKRHKWWYKTEKLAAIVCFSCLLIGIPFTLKSGIWTFTVFDTYAASGTTLLWMVFFESIAIGWLYGADKFFENIEEMIGFKPASFFKYCWKYLTPLCVLTIFINSTFISHQGLSQQQQDPYGYQYTWLDDGLGWSLAMASMLCVPGGWITYWLEENYMSGGGGRGVDHGPSPRVREVDGRADISTKSLMRSSDDETTTTLDDGKV